MQENVFLIHYMVLVLLNVYEIRNQNNFIKEYESIDIHTLEGTMRCSNGDYIIKGINGEFYPCKPDIFEKTYEPVND